jgi:hypothetical protein
LATGSRKIDTRKAKATSLPVDMPASGPSAMPTTSATAIASAENRSLIGNSSAPITPARISALARCSLAAATRPCDASCDW